MKLQRVSTLIRELFFLWGILLAVLGVHLKENKEIDLKILSEKIKEMCKPLFK